MQERTSLLTDASAALAHDRTAVYPADGDAPFHPEAVYPELTGLVSETSERNDAYRLVRECLAGLGLDRDRFGSPAWNPLGDVIRPGDRVVLKPNWVLHVNQKGLGMDCMVTHPSVLRAVLDYTIKAKPGRIVVGDAPIQLCKFDRLQDYGFRSVIDHAVARGHAVTVKDFRRTVFDSDPSSLELKENLRPMEDFVLFDLGRESLLEPITGDFRKFRVTMYDPRKMKSNHAPGVHRYLIARDMLEADAVINLPKLKMHKKAGITCALKNWIGINGNKDYLPHHRKGPAPGGGDNYPEASPTKWAAEQLLEQAYRHMDRKAVYRLFHFLGEKALILNLKLGGNGDIEGGWYGNDTIWRTCLDLNRILLYGDTEAMMHDTPQRRQISLADAIVIGENDGPLKPDPYVMGGILAAVNPAVVDWIGAYLMGLDPHQIPICAHAFGITAHPISAIDPSAIRCRFGNDNREPGELAAELGHHPRPAPGWTGHCERVSA